MNIRLMIAAFFALGVTLATDVSYGADNQLDPQPDLADAETPVLRNPALVETNHGQGLGPDGADLHYGNGIDPADQDTQLLLQALEEPALLELQIAPTAQNTVGDEVDGATESEVSAAP